MLPPERGRAILGAPPPRCRARAVVALSARPGDAGEAPVRRAAIRRRVGPQSREPGLDARQAVDRRVVATSKEAHLGRRVLGPRGRRGYDGEEAAHDSRLVN